LSPGNLTTQPDQEAAKSSSLLPLFLAQLSLKSYIVMGWALLA